MSTVRANEQIPPHTEDVLIAAENASADASSDADSVFSEHQISTASIASSILEYRRNHGRTYDIDKFAANYFLPNDERQLESVELAHHYLTILFNDQLFLAPLEKYNIHRVLDIGTGTGIWAIEFADQFPNTSVIGTDLFPCQPQWIPPNVRFEIDDATLQWTWNDNYFDFIHIRYIVGGVQDWTGLFKEAYRCCAPGGWVESVEIDPEFCSDDGTTELEPVFASVGELYREAGKILNRPFFVQEIRRQAFDEVGFVEKRVVRYKVPIGSWAKDSRLAEVGRFLEAVIENDLQGYTQMHHALANPSKTSRRVPSVARDSAEGNSKSQGSQLYDRACYIRTQARVAGPSPSDMRQQLLNALISLEAPRLYTRTQHPILLPRS